MKTSNWLFSLLLGLAILPPFGAEPTRIGGLVGAKDAKAQISEAEMNELAVQVGSLMGIMNAAGYTIVHVEVDRLSRGESKSATRTFHEGVTYAMLGYGGTGIEDLDLCLVQRGQKIRCDTRVDNLPIIEDWWCPNTRTMEIQSTAYSNYGSAGSSGEYYFCWVLGIR